MHLSSSEVQLTYPLEESASPRQPEVERVPPFESSLEAGASRARMSVKAAAKPAVDQVIAYLAPFLVLTAISQTSGLLTGADWFYPIGILAVLVTLWICRSAYRILRLTSDSSRSVRSLLTWEPLAVGLVVFALWAWLTRAIPNPAWVAALQQGPSYGDPWLAIRVSGFALVVPVAVELAFRGYLTRRIISADVDAVAPGTFGWVSFIASSVWFGSLQGPYWFVGTLQGMAYALALYRRGRVTDAILAHMVTNAALVVYAVNTGRWAAIL